MKLLTRNGDDLANCEFAIEGKTNAGDKLYKRYVSVAQPVRVARRGVALHGRDGLPLWRLLQRGVGQGGRQERRACPCARVLSFDIDLTDLEFLELKDDDGSVSAEKCDAAYPVSAAAAYIVRTVLQKAFGFSEILIVYSGRRGVHARLRQKSHGAQRRGPVGDPCLRQLRHGQDRLARANGRAVDHGPARAARPGAQGLPHVHRGQTQLV